MPRQAMGARLDASDGTLLATHLLGPGVTAIDPSPLARPTRRWPIPDVAPRGDADLAARQGARHLRRRRAARHATSSGSPHLMLGTDTPQPDARLRIDTVVPGAVDARRAGRQLARALSTDAHDVPGDDGAFGDIVSGPHAIAFTDDGALRARRRHRQRGRARRRRAARVEATLSRPLPGHLPEGIVARRRTRHATSTSATRATSPSFASTREGDGRRAHASTARRSRASRATRCPRTLRLGQHLFYSANSDEVPITTEPLGRVRELPHRGAQRRGHVALRAGPARHADERAAACSTPASSSAPPIATRCRTTGRRSTSSRAARCDPGERRRRRCSTRSPTT